MITTKKIKLTPKELFSIFILRYIKKRWWLFIGIWTVAIFAGLKEQHELFDKVIIILAIIYPFLLIIQFWRYSVSKENKIMLAERYYEIDLKKINGIIDEDTYSPVKLEHFIKVDLIKKNYLLFIAKNQFIYIPVNSFKNNKDKEWFENEIIEKIKTGN